MNVSRAWIGLVVLATLAGGLRAQPRHSSDTAHATPAPSQPSLSAMPRSQYGGKQLAMEQNSRSCPVPRIWKAPHSSFACGWLIKCTSLRTGTRWTNT